MLPLTKDQLLDILTRSILESGWNVIYISNTHPFRLSIYRDNERHNIRVYIWNLTHGGGSTRPQDEYRVQATGIPSRHFEAEAGGKTLILGWWDAVGVFTGFDYTKHTNPFGASPSFQIREEYLLKAHINGFAPCRKTNDEIAIAFRPSFFVEYVRNLESLHEFASSDYDLAVLNAVAEDAESVEEAEIETLSRERQITISLVRRRIRDISFQARVLTAYDHRCAVCNIQLNLINAAHIIPVASAVSTDETANGLALCTLHHRAYDRGLIYVDPNYTVQVNESHKQHLHNIGHDNGMDSFINGLRAAILLPPARNDRPSQTYLEAANRLRGVTRI